MTYLRQVIAAGTFDGEYFFSFRRLVRVGALCSAYSPIPLIYSSFLAVKRPLTNLTPALLVYSKTVFSLKLGGTRNYVFIFATFFRQIDFEESKYFMELVVSIFHISVKRWQNFAFAARP